MLADIPFQVSYYFCSRIARKIKNLLSKNKFDLIFVHLIRMSQYVLYSNTPKILDMVNLLGPYWQRSLQYRKGLSKMLHTEETKRLFNYEKKISTIFDRILLVSTTDLEQSRTYLPLGRFEIVHDGTDTQPLENINKQPFQIGIVGHYGVFHNRDAVEFLINEIAPVVVSKQPRARFLIIGSKAQKRWQKEYIKVTEEVKDVRPFLQSCSVYIAPTRFTAGAEIKVLEAMSLKVPVVATPFAVRGLSYVIPGKHCLVGDTPHTLSEYLLKIINNPDVADRLSQNAYELIKQKYRWNNVLEKLNDILASIKK
jgi:glycosyltransferase involved in cell wall biosynthesis